MTINNHLEHFAGRRVREFAPEAGITHPDDAWRLSLDYEQAESGGTIIDLLATFLDDPAAAKVSAILIGHWEEAYDQNSEAIINALAAARDRLPGLRALFLGEITYDECEISWIMQSNVSPLLNAFPNLEQFCVRGGSNLEFQAVKHAKLRHLAIETGGLDADVVRGVFASELPALEHLELWLGTGNYGRTTTPEHLQTLFSGSLFPNLTYLGLRNCEDSDILAAALAQAPILDRIKVLDMSLGDIGNAGVEALLNSPAAAKLESIDIHHHYASKELVAKLTALGPKVNAEDEKEPDDWGGGEMHRYISASE